MIQLAPTTRILVAVEPADFRRGIDGLARLCRKELSRDPMSGVLFVFRNRRRTSIKALCYDGQGFWLLQKRLSAGQFRYWPGEAGGQVEPMLAHELMVLLSAGDPSCTKAAPQWRPLHKLAEEDRPWL